MINLRIFNEIEREIILIKRTSLVSRRRMEIFPFVYGYAPKYHYAVVSLTWTANSVY